MPLKTRSNKLREKKNNEKNKYESKRYQRLKNNAELTIQARKKAHEIVLSLLELNVTEEEVREKVPYITPEHYADIIVERALTGICGYPLCTSTALDEKYNQQTYTIRNNKVFDVTHRRNFCSNKCYEASEIINKQIPTTPLYLRSSDPETQNFKLQVPDLSSLKGRVGKLINITGACDEDLNTYSRNQKKNLSPTTSESSQSILSDLSVSSVDKSNTSSEVCDLTSKSSDSINFSESSLEENISECYKSSSKKENLRIETCEQNFSDPSNKKVNKCSEISSNIESCLEDETKKLSIKDSEEFHEGSITIPKKEELSNKDKNLTSSENYLEDIFEVEKTLREWMNFEALRTILGDVYVRGMLEELGRSWEDYDTTSGLRLGIEGKAKYISLCKKLDKDEMKEKILDTNELDSSSKVEESEINRPRGTMPDYEELKRNVEESSIKVRAFYEGSEEFINHKKELETIKEEEEEEEEEERVDKKSSPKPKKKKKSGKGTKGFSESEIESVTLPLIDAYSQNTWRRQIVFEKLSKPLSMFVNEFGLDEGEIRRLVVSLIATFDLSPHNITLKTSLWKLMALVILKMLSIRYPIINEAFIPEGRNCETVTSFLQGLGLDPDYLNRLLSYVTEITFILTKYHRNDIVHHTNSVQEGSTNASAILSCDKTGDFPGTIAICETDRRSSEQFEKNAEVVNSSDYSVHSPENTLNKEQSATDPPMAHPSTNLEELD